MEEPTTYCGASSKHVICENYKFQADVTLKMFKRDEICSDFTWLDIKNCTGVLDHNTFKNLPNLEILNINNCTMERVEENTFATLKNLKSVDISRSTFPLNQNTFENCKNLDNLRFIKLGNKIEAHSMFRNIKSLEYLMFHHISELDLTKDMFLGLENLKYLFITKCTVENFSEDVFEHLKHLEMLYFTGNSLKNFSVDAFVNLIALKILGVYDNTTNSTENLNTDYNIFRNLPLLETIHFPEEELRKLDFNTFKSLKNVQLVVENASEDIIEFLAKKNVNIEWTGDTDLLEEPDFSDPNIQICA